MSIPGGTFYNPDEDFRLLHDEISDKYYIQKKRFIVGWKFISHDTVQGHLKLEFNNIEEARTKLKELRVENRKRKIKNKYVILKD